MIHFRPFRAVRPHPDKVSSIVTRSYFTYSNSEVKKLLESSPYSFFHIIYPALPIYPHKQNIERRYKAVRKRYLEAKAKHWFLQDPQPTFYYYRQKNSQEAYEGLIGIIAVENYRNGSIKKHENTLAQRERRLTRYLEIVQINAEPILLIESQDLKWETQLKTILEQKPLYDFAFHDNTQHTLWQLTGEWIQKIQNHYFSVDYLFIGDGHHRAEASLQYAQLQEKKQQTPNEKPYQFFLACIVQEQNVKVWEFNRIVLLQNCFNFPQFLEQIQQNFIVKEDCSLNPLPQHHFRIYYLDKCYTLQIRKELLPNNGKAIDHLDATLLNRYLFEPYLQIFDLRNDKRVEFIPGDKGVEPLRKIIQSGSKIAFQLPTPSIQTIKQIAMEGDTMPPKTTWILPKLLSGLTIFEIDHW